MGEGVTVAVALGSNLGDRASHLDHAVRRLAVLLAHLRVSRYVETEPVDVIGAQGRFLNAAAVAAWDGPPRTLLARLLGVERERGRRRPHRGAARTLDLDLILFGDCVLDEAGLTLPHPRFRERRFVLEPLCEVGPDLRDPVTGLTVRELLGRLPGGSDVQPGAPHR